MDNEVIMRWGQLFTLSRDIPNIIKICERCGNS